MRGNAIILNTIAKTLNVGGSAIVAAYDAGAVAFNTTMSALSPGEKTKLKRRIKTFEKKIKSLYGDIGKITLKYEDPAAALESEEVVIIIGSIKELIHEIEAMKERIIAIETSKAKQTKEEPKKATVDPSNVASFFIKSITNSLTSYLPGEKRALEHRIAENEKKIKALYSEFAKESANYPDPAAALTAKPVLDIITKINEHKAEVALLKSEIAELAVEKKPAKAETVTRLKQDEVATESTIEPVDVDNKEHVQEEIILGSNDSPAIGFTRTKACLIPTPSLQPPPRPAPD